MSLTEDIDLLFGGTGADSFIFTAGKDRVADFDTAQDSLTLESMLWNNEALIPGDVLFLFGHIEGADTMLDFDGGHSLTLSGITDWTALAAQIDYI